MQNAADFSLQTAVLSKFIGEIFEKFAQPIEQQIIFTIILFLFPKLLMLMLFFVPIFNIQKATGNLWSFLSPIFVPLAPLFVARLPPAKRPQRVKWAQRSGKWRIVRGREGKGEGREAEREGRDAEEVLQTK